MTVIGAFATILNDKGEVLLCHRRDIDVWDLPGGGAEGKEAPWDAVVREVQEEVGLHVKVERLVGVYWKPRHDAVVFQFACTESGGEAGPSEESDQVAYFPPDALPRNLAPNQRERIEHSLFGVPQTTLVVQEGPTSSELIERGLL